MKFRLKYLVILILLLGMYYASGSNIKNILSLASSPNPTPSPVPTATPTPRPHGAYCISEDEYKQIMAKPADITCCGREWIKIVDEALVKQIYIHAEKQLIPKDDPHDNPSDPPPSCTCEDPNDSLANTPITYYSWLCHPPSWGSIWNNTLWRLNDPDPNRPIKDNDKFTVYILKTATIDPNLPFICGGSYYRGYADGSFRLDSLTGEVAFITSSINDFINVNGVWGRFDRIATTNKIHFNPSREKLGEVTYKGTLYDAFYNLHLAFSPDKQWRFYLVGHGAIDAASDTDPLEYIVFDIITAQEGVSAKSLKLSDFIPIPPTIPPSYNDERQWFDIYLPESKPVLYLYPESKRAIDIKIHPKEGYVTVSDPKYDPDVGWKDITAYPDGKLLYQNKEYSSLYFETEVKGYRIPTEGFVIPIGETEAFFREKLEYLGLNQTERKDFLDYWAARIKAEVKTPYLFITFLSQSDINQVVPLDIAPAPDYLLRIRPYIKPVKQYYTAAPQQLNKPSQRNGYAVIEWGGILDK